MILHTTRCKSTNSQEDIFMLNFFSRRELFGCTILTAGLIASDFIISGYTNIPATMISITAPVTLYTIGRGIVNGISALFVGDNEAADEGLGLDVDQDQDQAQDQDLDADQDLDNDNEEEYVPESEEDLDSDSDYEFSDEEMNSLLADQNSAIHLTAAQARRPQSLWGFSNSADAHSEPTSDYTTGGHRLRRR